MSLLSFLFGLCVGSFLNVCVHRLPQGQSVVRPRSRCPICGTPIAPYDNIPLLSFIVLRGRCRKCHAVISPLYPTVELMTGLVFLLAFHRFGITPEALKAVLLASGLVVLVFTDLRDRLLPDAVTFPGMIAGGLLALWVPVGDGTAAVLLRWAGVFEPHAPVASLGDAALGALLGGGLLFLLGEAWLRLRKVEAMGFGDVKMMTMVGLFFGLKLTVLTLLLGSLVGSLAGGLYILLARKGAHYELPLGSFLGLAGLVALFWGDVLVGAYLGLLR